MNTVTQLPHYAPEIVPVSVACQKREAGREVALVACTEDEDLRAKTRNAIAVLGGTLAVVREGDRVFVQVNGTMAKSKDTGEDLAMTFRRPANYDGWARHWLEHNEQS